MAARVPRTSRALLTALLTLAAVVVLLIPIGAIIQIVLTSQLDDRTPTQAIIVLDPAGVWGDPTAVMNARLDHARDLYQDHVAPVIVLAGPPAAVRQATDHLVRGGVPKADIVGFSANSDTTGSLEVMIWSETFNKSQALLNQGAVVSITGRLDLREEGPRLTANELKPVKKPESVEKPLVLTLDRTAAKTRDLDVIRDIIWQNPGSRRVILRVTGGEKPLRIIPADEFRVNPEAEAKLAAWIVARESREF